MARIGYIKVHREAMEHWLYNEEPFDKWHAWEDILLSANHTYSRKLYKGKIQVIKAGQLPTSIKLLAQRWRWDRKKVMRFLDVLERDNMISQNRTSYGTTITIENWDKWQNGGTSNGTPKGTANRTPNGTSDGTPNGTHYKNDKNVKNDKKLKNPPISPRRVDDWEGAELSNLSEEERMKLFNERVALGYYD